MRMSREAEITMTHAFGDQGKNDSAVLFYRRIADYSLIARLVSALAYSSSDGVRPQSMLRFVFYYSPTFDVWSRHIPRGTVAQKT